MPALDGLFTGRSESVRATWERLAAELRALGPVEVEEKKTSLHVTAGPGTSAFAGVHPRTAAILLNLRTSEPIGAPRIRKREQVSRNRWHNELLLESSDDVDAELVGWLAEAYRLSRPD